MTVFALMDEWIACTGRTDDAWLGLGLDLLEAWQTGAEAGHPMHCQGHLAAVLAELRTLRAVAVAPDPVALAAWFHHCGRLHSSLLDRLAEVGGPALGVRVGWLVRGLEATGSRSEDPAAVLLLTAHRRAQVGSRLAPVRAASPDQ
ncbi:MAG: hypothetical protein QOE24_2724 [Frankiales bacterium]|nr:hypothetical protein [Frankiales bacterium]